MSLEREIREDLLFVGIIVLLLFAFCVVNQIRIEDAKQKVTALESARQSHCCCCHKGTP